MLPTIYGIGKKTATTTQVYIGLTDGTEISKNIGAVGAYDLDDLLGEFGCTEDDIALVMVTTRIEPIKEATHG